MKFTSSRNSTNNATPVTFSEAVLNCMPDDGGMYVPAYEENLSPWILYMNSETSFSSIAGSLTSALINDEFSPIICEAIATKAFPFSPSIRKLDDHLFVLELFTGPTGCYKDFGISYLAACLDYICLMENRTATVLAVTNGETGASIVQAFRGKKNLKAVLLYTKGTVRGFDDSDLIANGGNIYPVEADGTEAECFDVVRSVYEDKALVQKYGLTLANTVNIGRVLPLTFCYVYAFSRIKKQIAGDIYYAMDAGNYGNLTAGLYGWKFSLPVTGFITNCSESLVTDQFDKCCVLDSVVPLLKRNSANPANPSNLERIEELFVTRPAVMKGMVFPAYVNETEKGEACKDCFKKYGYFLDEETASAYAAAKKRKDIVLEDDGSVVLIARKHPSMSADNIKYWCGEKVAVPENIAPLYVPKKAEKLIKPEKEEILKILNSLQ